MKTGIFELTNADRAALQAHLLGLSSHDRYFRFFCTLQDAALEHQARTMSLAGSYGYFVAGELAAVACVLPSESNAVEFAVSVSPAWRGHGLSRLLLEYGLETTQADRADRMFIQHLSENVAMAAVSRHVPGARSRAGAEVTVEVDLSRLREESAKALETLCAAEAA